MIILLLLKRGKEDRLRLFKAPELTEFAVFLNDLSTTRSQVVLYLISLSITGSKTVNLLVDEVKVDRVFRRVPSGQSQTVISSLKQGGDSLDKGEKMRIRYVRENNRDEGVRCPR